MANTTIPPYTIPPASIPGLISTIVAGFISLIIVVAFLFYMLARAAVRSAGGSTRSNMIGDRHLTAYFYSLLFSSVLKALSVVMSLKWIHEPMTSGAFCTVQAAFTLTGNVGTAVWSMVIAMHLFNLLFLSMGTIKWSLPAVLALVWSLLLADVLIGPVAFTDFFGPYDGSSNTDDTTCWITNRHSTTRFMLQYVPTALTPFVSIIVLGLILLHLRGNLFFTNGRIKLRLRLHADDVWHNKMMRSDLDRSILATIQRMIWFPITYFLLWAPVAISRLIQLTGRQQPFGFVATGLFLYALTGAADVVLFLLTRHVIMPDGVVAPAVAELDREKTIEALTGPVSPLILAAPSGPRPLVLNATQSLSRSSSSSSASSYDSTTGLLSASASMRTGATIPTFIQSASAYSRAGSTPLPPVPAARRGPPSARSISDVSMITSARPREAFSPSTARTYATNFMSMSSDAGTAVPSARPESAVSVASTYSDQAGIMSAYAHTPGMTSRPDVHRGSQDAPASAHTFGGAVHAAGPEIVAPLAPSETVKAQLYGARFSLVAGPMPAYNYDRPDPQ